MPPSRPFLALVITVVAGLPCLQAAEVDATLTAPALQALAAGGRVTIGRLSLPDGRSVALDLAEFEVVARDARFVVVDGDGARDVPRPDFRAYRGAVPGEAGSLAVLTIAGGLVRGSIRTGVAEYTVVPIGSGGRLLVRDRASDPDEPDSPMCGNAALERGGDVAAVAGVRRVPRAVAVDSTTLLTAGVAIDATYAWYSRFGNLTAAQGYILNLMAQVSTIYESEVNVRIEVPYLRVFSTSTDPYSDTTDTSTLLSELRSEWNAHQNSVARTVVHLFSTRPSGGAGVAYLDVLCSHDAWPGHSYDYGVSTLSAGGASWEKTLVAHELGHNFSSPHTHCYVPEIDRCANESGCYSGAIVQTTGTIMSYCNQVSPVFHTRVETERIRPAAEEAVPACMTVEAGSPPPPPEGLVVE